ncbi:uncharacterized protein TNCV_483251 [Trichonephila clavipes]|uniref:Uncharacterized protein n=1 Tax=Trichonephila clavipes TaxID=2585209 RepID=A0A8X6RFI8_TRICX|nr:uncharacterized protein TNCV_483251 [Trichonephila clavipes]
MVSVRNLLDQCRHRTTIVFGNLGQWPDRVTYYEQEYPNTIIFEPIFGVELRFFQVGRTPSRRVWDAYKPQNTDAYTLDFTEFTRVADVYVKWLTWLDDWEMHRDDNVPWRMVGLQPGKRALEKNEQSSHEKALANGMPSNVTLLEHI